jgi:flagellar biosynthetic protein FlhB
MADDSDLERTEPASQRRLEQAREEGHVPQSRELSAFLVLIAGAGGVWVMGSWLANQVGSLMRQGLRLDHRAAFDESAMAGVLVELGSGALLTLAPLFVVLILAAVAGPIVLGGRVFSAKAFAADWSRIDPIKGFGRIFSIQGLAELLKALAKAALICGIALWVMWHEHQALFNLLSQPLHAGLASFFGVVMFSTVLIVAGMALIAAADVPFQLWQYHSRLRMTKEEVRQEAKELEGDPQVKARIRSQQREMARRRMMAEVPKADVVVTNPTHFAVALKYEAARMSAPRVVAKGRGLLAQRIREIAAESGVPTLEAPPLARALYRHADLGEQVPSALYTAVAEVMAYVYQLHAFLHQGAPAPDVPNEIAVPPTLDPGAEYA